MRTRALLRALFAALVVVGTLAYAATDAYALPAVLGGGSGFAALEIDQWRADTARAPFNLTVNYVAQGSSFGRQQFTSGADFGASDIQYVDAEIPQLQNQRCAGKSLSACFVYVPVSAGGVSFMYNLLDNNGNPITNLRLTRQAVCKIFTGQITRWNDPEIVATNPKIGNLSRDITPVIRADGAGESYVFSEFCIAAAPQVWNKFIADSRAGPAGADLSGEFVSGKPTSLWPQQWGHSVPIAFADGTANYVADPGSGANSITYVAAGYAKVRSFPVASVQNAAGVFTQPDEDNVTVALGYATPRGNGTFNLAYSGADKRAYFPSTYSYVLAQTTGYDPGRGATLGQFLCYAISQGQVIAPSLRYARLSAPLVAIAIDAISQIPGAPDKNHCFIGVVKPPPPPVVAGGGGGFGGPSGGGGPGGAGGTNSSGGTGATNGSAGGPRSAAARKAALQRAARAAALAGGAGCVTTTTTTSTTTTTTTTTTVPKTTTTTTSTTVPGSTTTTIPKTTTTTTVVRRALNAERAAASGAGCEATTTTINQQALNDAELARAAGNQTHKGGGTPTGWILLAGLGGAWGVSVFASRRRKVTG